MENNTISKSKLWTSEFLMLTLCNLFLFLTLQMVLTTLPAYAEEAFKAGPAQLSLITSLFAFSAILSRLFSSKALEKGKRRQLLYGGLTLCLLATIGYYLAPGIISFLTLRILFGIGFGMTSTSFPTMASDLIPRERLGEGMGYFGLSTTLALSVGPMIGLSLFQGGGFGPLVFLTAAINLLIFPMTSRLISRTRRDHKEPNHEKWENSGSKFGIPQQLILPGVLNFLMSVTYGGLLGFIALFGRDSHLSNPQYFFLFNAFSIVLVRPFAGRLYDRFGHKAIILPGSVMISAGLWLLAGSASTAGLLLSALCYGSGFGAMQPAIQTWMIQQVHPKQRGMANGMFLNTIDLGIALGTLVLGAIASAAGYAAMYRWSVVAIALLIIVYMVNRVQQGRDGRRKNSIG